MISQMEKGTRGASAASLLRLSAVLGCSVEQLLQKDHGMPKPLTDFLDMVKDEDTVTQEEIETLRAVTLPGRRITKMAYAHLLDAIRKSERMHS